MSRTTTLPPSIFGSFVLYMANLEYRALLQCAHGLTDLLQHNLSVSDKLLEKGWITRDVHGWALTARGVSDQEKASRLVSCLADRVKEAAQVFHDFVDVLKEDPFFADIVEKLNAEYSMTHSMITINVHNLSDISPMHFRNHT
jgi:hypothetical protein